MVQVVVVGCTGSRGALCGKTPQPVSDSWSKCRPIRRQSTTRPAVERWGPETEQAAERSSLGRTAAGSFVRNEPELVSVEGVFKSALGGVKPLTDIAATAQAEDNAPHNTIF